MNTKKLADIKPGEHFYTYTQGMRGHFAVEMWMNDREPELGAFAEPWASDDRTYSHPSDAKNRAMSLADFEDLPFVD